MRVIAHLINCVAWPSGSPAHAAQAVTFASMTQARQEAESEVRVRFISAQYSEDRPAVPEMFEMTGDMDRSVLDLRKFRTPRKLPLLGDILSRLYEASKDAEYLIYSNSDIALMPFFYRETNRLIERGCEAFAVTRRDLPGEFQSDGELSGLYARAGRAHVGHDCFVFKRAFFPAFYVADICLGTAFMGAAIFLNLVSFVSRFQEFRDRHMTFHLGSTVRRGQNREYFMHNASEFLKIRARLAQKGVLKSHPWIEEIPMPMIQRAFKRKSTGLRTLCPEPGALR